ncbi:MAG: RNA polymerase sigma factor [Gemmataceae bacterium]
MSHTPLHTTQMLELLDRIRGGERAAEDELIRHVVSRLELLTRHMLLRFSSVRRWSDTDDVLQDSLVRLMRSLREVRPANTREFFGLASTMVRRQLIDLARHYYGPLGLGKNHASDPNHASEGRRPLEHADTTFEPSQLEQWREVHERIDSLPTEEREVVELLFYQGLTQEEAARVLQVNVRTIQRRWHAALLKLHRLLQDQWPGL